MGLSRKFTIRESFRFMVSRANFVKLDWKLLYYYQLTTTQRRDSYNNITPQSQCSGIPRNSIFRFRRWLKNLGPWVENRVAGSIVGCFIPALFFVLHRGLQIGVPNNFKLPCIFISREKKYLGFPPRENVKKPQFFVIVLGNSRYPFEKHLRDSEGWLILSLSMFPPKIVWK